jgi:hypothetical protein
MGSPFSRGGIRFDVESSFDSITIKTTGFFSLTGGATYHISTPEESLEGGEPKPELEG